MQPPCVSVDWAPTCQWLVRKHGLASTWFQTQHNLYSENPCEFPKLYLNVLKYNLSVLQLLRHLVVAFWAGATFIGFYLLVSSFVRVWSLKIKSGPQSSSRGEGKPGKYMCMWKCHLQVARFTFSCPAGSTRKAEEGQRIGEVGRFLPSVS